MKNHNYLIVFISTLITITANAQNAIKPASEKHWIQMMKDPKANIHDVENVFNKWYSEAHEGKVPGEKLTSKTGEKAGNEEEEDDAYTLFQRWKWYNLPRADIHGNRPDIHNIAKNYNDYKRRASAHSRIQSNPCGASVAEWTYAGNTKVPKYDTSYHSANYGGDGRVNRVRIMPGNNSIMFACTPSGGLWKTIDGGASWSTNTDQLGDLFTSDMAINPSKTSIMYLATGDGDGIENGDLGDYNIPGTVGILKSFNGGTTWNATSFTSLLDTSSNNLDCVTELLIDPKDTSVILAATTFGIWRSANSGATWTQTLTGFFHSIEFQPGNPSVVYAASEIYTYDAAFYRSADNGVTWSIISSGLPAYGNVDRYQIAVSPADTNVVYVLADSSSNFAFEGLYRSTDNGVTFSTMSSVGDGAPNLLGRACDGSDYSVGQGWYDLSIVVSPTNINQVWVGGIAIWLSDNGGATWSLATSWETNECAKVPLVHADIHWIEPVPGNSSSYVVSCDGGVSVTANNGTTWSDISNNLELGQQYTIGTSAFTPGLWLTGWQDNGANLSGSPWKHLYFGDVYDCFIDWSNNNNLFIEQIDGKFYSSSDAGHNWSSAVGGITEPGIGVGYTPWMQDPQTPGVLYSGFQNVWKSTNRGVSWFPISTWDSGANIYALAVDSSNPDYIYASTFLYGSPSAIEVTANGGTSWTNITGTLPVDSAVISAIAINSKKPSHLWVTFTGYSSGNKVFSSTDGGTTWTNISSGLPNLPVNCIVAESGSPEGIYIGTDQGVYYHDTILNNWVFYNTGLPLVMVSDLSIYQPAKTLLAATFGRGTWQSPLSHSTAPAATITRVKDVLCIGQNTGELRVIASGGKSPFTYYWSNSNTNSIDENLSAGNYTVTITDQHGCTVTAAATVTQPSTAVYDSIVSYTNVSCLYASNACASVGAKDGTSPYAFKWSSGATTTKVCNLDAGSYQCLVTDANGCTNKVNLIITHPAALVVTFTQTNILCYGQSDGSIAAAVGGGTTPYTYSWSNQQTLQRINALPAGNYSVKVTDANGCSVSATTAIIQPSRLYDTITSLTCINKTGKVYSGAKGGRMNYSFSWAPSGGTKEVATGLTNGTYTISVTDANGCTATVSVMVSCSGAIDEPANSEENGTSYCPVNSAITGITLFPNPNRGIFTLQLPATGLPYGGQGYQSLVGTTEIEIYNVIGEEILSISHAPSADNTILFNIAEYPAGMYLMHIVTPDGENKVFKVIKE